LFQQRKKIDQEGSLTAGAIATRPKVLFDWFSAENTDTFLILLSLQTALCPRWIFRGVAG
jgi:hypothetical protein